MHTRQAQGRIRLPEGRSVLLILSSTFLFDVATTVTVPRRQVLARHSARTGKAWVFARQTPQENSLRFASSNSSLLMTPTSRDCPTATALQTSAGESATSPDTPRCDVPQDTDEKGVGPRRPCR